MGKGPFGRTGRVRGPVLGGHVSIKKSTLSAFAAVVGTSLVLSACGGTDNNGGGGGNGSGDGNGDIA